MSTNPKISIIIPVYGVENYIAKCIESIKAQTFTDFEAVLINDGTKDNSVVVAEQAIAGDDRFVILHKENGGQGSARNLGLDKARGDYIAFIDSDDWVEPDYLKAMYEKIVTENADVCTCNVRYIDENGETLELFSNNVKGYMKNNDFLLVGWNVSNFMWDKLYKKNLFLDLRFDITMKTNEDVHLVFRLIYNKKITSTSGFYYNYLQRANSTSKGVPPEFLTDRNKIRDEHANFAKQNHLVESYRDYLIHAYLKSYVFLCVIFFSRYSTQFDKDIAKLNENIDPAFFNFKNILRAIKRERKVGLTLLLFRLSPTLTKQVIRFKFKNKVA